MSTERTVAVKRERLDKTEPCDNCKGSGVVCCRCGEVSILKLDVRYDCNAHQDHKIVHCPECVGTGRRL